MAATLDPLASVVTVLERSIRAGVIPGGVAGWGPAGASPLVAEIGSAAVVPEPRPTTRSAWYDLASLTKPLVVTSLCLLAFRRGALRQSTTVGEVLAEARQSLVADVNIRQLLSHSSGLPAWYPLYAVNADPELALHTILGLDLEAAPGTRAVYSCLDFILLGVILERVSDARLDRLFHDEVLNPLGLQDELGFLPSPLAREIAGASALPTAEQEMTADRGLDPASVPPPAVHLPDDGNARFLGGVAGNAGLFGSLDGVWRLAVEFLPGRGSLLLAEEIREAVSEVARGPNQVRGLGWQLASTPGCSAGPSLDSASYGHTGFTGPSLWLDPVRSAAFVLLTNRHHPGHRGVDLHPLRRAFHRLASPDIDPA